MKLFKARFNQRSETPDSELQPNPVRSYALCNCLARPTQGPRQAPKLHTEFQDTNSDAWKSLEAYIQRLAKEGSDEFNPLAAIGHEKWERILTLPKSIATLQSVKFMSLYGSHLVRIPIEIGEMKNLEEFDPYTSYRLHWFPFEITRCTKLTRSRVSTRALYGNYKYRPPFPHLPEHSPDLVPATCSVCGGPFREGRSNQVWISLRVATDVLPLLVNACSVECVGRLPAAEPGYVPRPHQGGLNLYQPPRIV